MCDKKGRCRVPWSSRNTQSDVQKVIWCTPLFHSTEEVLFEVLHGVKFHYLKYIWCDMTHYMIQTSSTSVSNPIWKYVWSVFHFLLNERWDLMIHWHLKKKEWDFCIALWSMSCDMFIHNFLYDSVPLLHKNTLGLGEMLKKKKKFFN